MNSLPSQALNHWLNKNVASYFVSLMTMNYECSSPLHNNCASLSKLHNKKKVHHTTVNIKSVLLYSYAPVRQAVHTFQCPPHTHTIISTQSYQHPGAKTAQTQPQTVTGRRRLIIHESFSNLKGKGYSLTASLIRLVQTHSTTSSTFTAPYFLYNSSDITLLVP